ncbi:hypothetical protein [Fibrobacter succinogenes]|uniref:hypothetical protein n=1 Tax=Fibrobacter succinogenes TaxID=833 RepID=UPI0026EAE1D2|nr:hypothetical protein [Fibrobacter succinogenes]
MKKTVFSWSCRHLGNENVLELLVFRALYANHRYSNGLQSKRMAKYFLLSAKYREENN